MSAASIPKIQDRSTSLVGRYKDLNPTTQKVALLAGALLCVGSIAMLATGLSLSLKDVAIAGSTLTTLSGVATLGLVYLNQAAPKIITKAPIERLGFTRDNPQILRKVLPTDADLQQTTLTSNLAKEYHRISYLIAGTPIEKRLAPSEEAYKINDVEEFINKFRAICNKKGVTDETSQNRALFYLQQDVSTAPMFESLTTELRDYRVVDTGATALQQVHINENGEIYTELSGKLSFTNNTTDQTLYATYHVQTNCKTGEISYWFTDMEELISSTSKEIPEDFHEDRAFRQREFPQNLGQDLPRASFYINQTRYAPARDSPPNAPHEYYKYMLACSNDTGIDLVIDPKWAHFVHQNYRGKLLEDVQKSLATQYPKSDYVFQVNDPKGSSLENQRIRVSKTSPKTVKITTQMSIKIYRKTFTEFPDYDSPPIEYTVISTIPDHTKPQSTIRLFRKMSSLSLIENLQQFETPTVVSKSNDDALVMNAGPSSFSPDDDAGRDFIL